MGSNRVKTVRSITFNNMKYLIVLVFLFCTVFASLTQDSQQWEQFKAKYGKTYRNVQEEKLRYSIFQQNLKEIEEHNAQYEAGETSYTKAINQFADITTDEFHSILNHQSQDFSNLGITSVYERPPDVEVPKSMDWRIHGAVSEVKNQGTCGSCWSFSVTGTLEGFNYIKHKKMVLLSEQQLLDCVPYYSCIGGDEGPALKYVAEHGIQTEESYPYKEKQLTCHYNKSEVAVKIKGYVQIKRGDEEALLSAVGTLGPVSVALDASEIKNYHSEIALHLRCQALSPRYENELMQFLDNTLPCKIIGIFHSDTCSKVATNHAVLAVGYGKDATTGLDYWLIKNSYGSTWGDKGYMKLKRGSNECAIAIDNVFPVL